MYLKPVYCFCNKFFSLTLCVLDLLLLSSQLSCIMYALIYFKIVCLPKDYFKHFVLNDEPKNLCPFLKHYEMLKNITVSSMTFFSNKNYIFS